MRGGEWKDWGIKKEIYKVSVYSAVKYSYLTDDKTIKVW